MASMGLGLMEGRQLWENERRVAEENERFIAGRGLFDMTLAEQEEAMRLQQEEGVQLRENKRALFTNSAAMAKGDPNGYVDFLNATNKDPNTSWKLSTDTKGGSVAELVDKDGVVLSTKKALVGEEAIAEAQKQSVPADKRADMERNRSAEELAFKRQVDLMEREYLAKGDLQKAAIAAQYGVASMNNAASASRLAMSLQQDLYKLKVANEYDSERNEDTFDRNKELLSIGQTNAMNLLEKEYGYKGEIAAATSRGLVNAEQAKSAEERKKYLVEHRSEAVQEARAGLASAIHGAPITIKDNAMIDARTGDPVAFSQEQTDELYKGMQNYEKAEDIAAQNGGHPASYLVRGFQNAKNKKALADQEARAVEASAAAAASAKGLPAAQPPAGSRRPNYGLTIGGEQRYEAGGGTTLKDFDKGIMDLNKRLFQ